MALWLLQFSLSTLLQWNLKVITIGLFLDLFSLWSDELKMLTNARLHAHCPVETLTLCFSIAYTDAHSGWMRAHKQPFDKNALVYLSRSKAFHSEWSTILLKALSFVEHKKTFCIQTELHYFCLCSGRQKDFKINNLKLFMRWDL